MNTLKDESFGLICENIFHNAFPSLKKTQDRNAIFDFYNKKKRKIIELKTRRYCFNSHLKDWQIGINKIKEAKKLFDRGYRVIFYMLFYDGLYYWSYHPDKVETDLYVKLGGRVDRGKNEEKNYYYIKSDCMTESKKKIKAPEPPDPFEECLI